MLVKKQNKDVGGGGGGEGGLYEGGRVGGGGQKKNKSRPQVSKTCPEGRRVRGPLFRGKYEGTQKNLKPYS